MDRWWWQPTQPLLQRSHSMTNCCNDCSCVWSLMVAVGLVIRLQRWRPLWWPRSKQPFQLVDKRLRCHCRWDLANDRRCCLVDTDRSYCKMDFLTSLHAILFSRFEPEYRMSVKSIRINVWRSNSQAKELTLSSFFFNFAAGLSSSSSMLTLDATLESALIIVLEFVIPLLFVEMVLSNMEFGVTVYIGEIKQLQRFQNT